MPQPQTRVVGPERYQRRITDWLSTQPSITHVAEVRENTPGGGLFTGLSVVAELDESAHAAEVTRLVTSWAHLRGTRAWTLSLAARVSIILSPGTRGVGVGDAWAALMADERLTLGSALSPRADAPGAAVVLQTEGPALAVLWDHLNAGQRGHYRPRRAIAPPEAHPAEQPSRSFNVEVEGPQDHYWLSGSAELLLACRPALESLTAAVDGSPISGIFHNDDFAIVTVWPHSDAATRGAHWAWELACPPEGAELRIERPWA
ncbi:MAG: hypothetical protein Q4F67_03130 [Propionibacteriaceae bacterium]|nr:hypothetical protein [Propionibacteriaceae bacterium]